MSPINALNPAEICLDCAPNDKSSSTATLSTSADVNQPVASTSAPGRETQMEDVMDPETFIAPDLAILTGPAVLIEYCDKCRWGPRASWISTELFLTFPAPTLASITLMPCIEPAGRFRVWLKLSGEGQENRLLWDRKLEGAFPELKLLKQRIRNLVQPEKDLGHSDKQGSKTVEG